MLRDVYDALADTIRTDLDFDGMDVVVEPRMVLKPAEPCIDMYPGSPARDSDSAAFGDISGFEVVTVRFRCAANDHTETQDLLLDLNDDTHALCMAAAIESNQDLDGWATGVWVDADSFSGVLDFSTTASQLVGCTWRVLIARADS